MADEMRKIMMERFQNQDEKKGFFDVTFKIQEKDLLHAHRFLLSTASPVFEAMFSDNWNPASGPIEIKTCSFKTFQQFVVFFYEGSCNFDESVIFDIIDLAEMYQVQPLKNKFDIFLSEMKFTDENIYKLLEVSEIYGFEKLKISLSNYLLAQWERLFERNDFLKVSKEVLLGILGLDRDGNENLENALFEEVFTWVENQVQEKYANFDALSLDEQQAMIKVEMAPFLPKFEFGSRSVAFLSDYFVGMRRYIFDDYEDFIEKAQQNRDDLDDETGFYKRIQILPYDFNGRYHQFLRGTIRCENEEPLNEFVECIEALPNKNGAYIARYADVHVKDYRDLESDESGSYVYVLGLHWGSNLVLFNDKIFLINQSLMDTYNTVCYLDGKNFPDIDEKEHYFCIQIL
uniref:BTB domain-containing protein n=1 Tax=Panagrolaimus sp. ES5 TaxID=591445 RepID=A0AC34F9P8_9BILA